MIGIIILSLLIIIVVSILLSIRTNISKKKNCDNLDTNKTELLEQYHNKRNSSDNCCCAAKRGM